MKKIKTSFLPRLLDIFMIIAAMILAFSIVFYISEYRDAKEAFYSVNSFHYRLEDSDYAAMVDYRHENAGYEVNEKELSEYYAVADYYEAASLYKIYSDGSSPAKEAYYARKMNDAAGKMGIFSAEKAKIDAVLGL